MKVSEFEEKSIICDCDEVRNQIYDRIEDEVSFLMKSKSHSENVEESELDNELEKLINLHHPCIAAPIGFVFRNESGSRQELKIFRMYLDGCSLSEVISVNPVWWTSTVKAKAIAGIVLGLRFAHSLGLLHGHLTGNNILFDSDHCIEIVDFKAIDLAVRENDNEERTQLGDFSGEGWTLVKDVQAFALILFEIVFGGPPQSEMSIPTGIPDFVSEIIISGLSPFSGTSYSFNTILDILKQNDFQIDDGVDSAEVSAFVNWVESAE
jgi:serine/threonine protein kinase